LKIDFIHNQDALIIQPVGELDHHAARDLFRRFSSLTDILPHRCILDLSKITFMDSSGIAVVLGLRKRLSYINGDFSVQNAAPKAMRTFRAAGVEKLVEIEESLHNASNQ